MLGLMKYKAKKIYQRSFPLAITILACFQQLFICAIKPTLQIMILNNSSMPT